MIVTFQCPTPVTAVTIPYIKGTSETISRILQPYNYVATLADKRYNIASRAAQSNSVYVSVLQIPIVHAQDSVSKSLRQKSRRI